MTWELGFCLFDCFLCKFLFVKGFESCDLVSK